MNVCFLLDENLSPTLLNQPFGYALGDISTPTPEMPARCKILVEKRQSETLTPGEHEKLLQLTERFEALNAQRMEAHVALARLLILFNYRILCYTYHVWKGCKEVSNDGRFRSHYYVCAIYANS
jgi:hypothetical protein